LLRRAARSQEDGHRHRSRQGREDAAVHGCLGKRPSFARRLGNSRAQCGAARKRRANVPAVNGQYVAYTFFRIDRAWRRLPVEERAAGKDAFAEVVEDWATRMDTLRAYTVTGVRPDCD